MNLLEKLSAIADRHSEVGKSITDPDIISDMKRYPVLMREYKELTAYVDMFNAYSNALKDIEAGK